MKRHAVLTTVLATGLALSLAGCAGSESGPAANGTSEVPAAVASTTPVAGASSTPVTGASTSSDDLLRRHGLDGLDTPAIIARLEGSQEDRVNGPVGSVTATELQLRDDQGETTLPVPDGRFYLSIAPYLTRTHDCFNHNLATCQGELTDVPLKVRVVANDGSVLLDQGATTGSNGFAGLWLPRDTQATLTVEYDGKQATQDIGTGADDPTCLTTLRLS